MIDRRALMVSGAASLAAAPTRAAEAKSVKVSKVFAYLDSYWALPATQRSRFAPAYYFRENDGPMASGRLIIVDGAARTPLPLGADGRVLRLPNAAQLRRAVMVGEGMGKGRMGVRLELHATLAPAARLDARELGLAIAEGRAAVAKIAGAFSFAAPKITSADFPGAGSGEAILASGGTAALPVAKGEPYYNPAKLAGARTIALARPPAKILLGSNA